MKLSSTRRTPWQAVPSSKSLLLSVFLAFLDHTIHQTFIFIIIFFDFLDSAGNEAQQHQAYALANHPKQQISIIISFWVSPQDPGFSGPLPALRPRTSVGALLPKEVWISVSFGSTRKPQSTTIYTYILIYICSYTNAWRAMRRIGPTRYEPYWAQIEGGAENRPVLMRGSPGVTPYPSEPHCLHNLKN